jgi:hypothetical protein
MAFKINPVTPKAQPAVPDHVFLDHGGTALLEKPKAGPSLDLAHDDLLASEEFRTLVDETAELELRMKEAKDRFEKKKAELQSILSNEVEPDQKKTFKGFKHRVTISACATERDYTPGALATIMGWVGKTAFLEMVKLPLKMADDYLTPEQRAQVLDTIQTDTRRLSFKSVSHEED